MANTRLVMGGSNAHSTSESFTPFGTGFDGAASDTTESRCQITWRSAGNVTNLLVNCITHTSNTVVTVRIGGVNKTNTVTLAATGITEDTGHMDSITAGNLMDYDLSALASTMTIFATTFAATTNTATKLVSKGSGVPGTVTFNTAN